MNTKHATAPRALARREGSAASLARAPAASLGAPGAGAAARLKPPAAVQWQQLRGVLLDLDGTLTNSDPLHLRAYQDTLLKDTAFNGGRPIDEHFFRTRISGRHIPDICADLFPHWSPEKLAQFYTDKQGRFRELAGALLKPLDGLPAFLAWVDSRALRKGLVSNAPRGNTECMLGALQLDTYFEVVVLGDECTRAKPAPEPYLEGLRRLGLSPREALAVEDSPSGIQAAVAAGIPVIGITTCQPPELLLAAGACCVCRDFTGIMDMIEQDRRRQSGAE